MYPKSGSNAYMKYKALLLDVDGTLVPIGPHTIPSKKVVDALIEAKTKIAISLVSGRPLRWLSETFEVLGLTDPCIINGGTQIVNPKTHQILWERIIENETVKKVLQIADEHNLSFQVTDEGIEYQNPQQNNFKRVTVIQLQYMATKEEAEKYAELLAVFPDVAVHKIFSWKLGSYDLYLTHRDATKQHATQELARLLGINTSEIIGVGDGENDIPLLRECGLKIAMGNAVEELKKMADYTASPLEKDGVAEVVEKFILQ